MISKKSKIFIAGHNGLVGSNCQTLLERSGYKNILTINSTKLDLRKKDDLHFFLKKEKPDIIINAAAKVGGILANSMYQYDFLIENMMIQNNLISLSHEQKIKKFIFLGSSCIYPKNCKQPIKEKYLLESSLEKTNEGYALAKITGIKLCEYISESFNKEFISLMPCNLYGPNDNFDRNTSHVIPAMIRKFHHSKIENSKEVVLWGTGNPLREFLYVDDLASAIKFSIENEMAETIYNVGSGEEISIKKLAELIAEIVNFNGLIKWNDKMPDATPPKFLDSSKFSKLGWQKHISLREGISMTYRWFKQNIHTIKERKFR